MIKIFGLATIATILVLLSCKKSFVDIVKKYKLNTRDFAPFTDYVAHSWPEMPQEFLVQCYATWRANPDYMRRNAPKLFEWFESGGHLGISKPTK